MAERHANGSAAAVPLPGMLHQLVCEPALALPAEQEAFAVRPTMGLPEMVWPSCQISMRFQEEPVFVKTSRRPLPVT